jgi:hypothetical protein
MYFAICKNAEYDFGVRSSRATVQLIKRRLDILKKSNRWHPSMEVLSSIVVVQHQLDLLAKELVLLRLLKEDN